MVKSVLGVAHQGLRDWIIQRLSAIYMAAFFVAFLGYLAMHPGLTFNEWQLLFAHQWMKIASILLITLMLAHAWVGIWTVLTDYVHAFVIRAILNTIIMLLFAACFFWGVMILWSV